MTRFDSAASKTDSAQAGQKSPVTAAIWTVESLAASAGMSRSAFAQHFKGIVGIPPLDHLTNWRMYRARCLLGNSDLALTRIAEQVGYETDGAFNRAFKRVVGMTPGEYRRRQSADKINQGHLA
ncbi:AraC family transcriptional regulator [Ferrovum sp.]|uniref:helix-turn-helix transcriptional regulator n=1 Tax=Ferrovum sp. TaxID=2609467 RepID=UPI00263437D6|nr:AraC family transcriptional regulator [Ferrovum sp.]